jgi:hypothetical protein
MKKDLLKKMKYEMPGMPGKGKPMPEETEIEISMGPESADEEGMPEMPEDMAEEMDVEEAEGPDLSVFSDEELQAELDKRMSKPAAKPSAKMV